MENNKVKNSTAAPIPKKFVRFFIYFLLRSFRYTSTQTTALKMLSSIAGLQVLLRKAETKRREAPV
jgi:hypothetical protein